MAFLPEQVLQLPSRVSPPPKESLQASTSLSSSSSQHFGDLSVARPARLHLSAPRGVEVKAHLLRFEAQPGVSSDARPFSRSNLSFRSPRLQHLMVQAAKKTYSSFDDLLKSSETAVLVDFYATWCGPCQFMVPILDDVGRALKDRVRIVKIDSERYPGIASRYGVQALPTLVLFQNGQPVDRLEGAMTAPELIRRVEGVLSSLKAKARD